MQFVLGKKKETNTLFILQGGWLLLPLGNKYFTKVTGIWVAIRPGCKITLLILQGGGLKYLLGNKHFNEEHELTVAHNRTGWAVVQPNRPIHLHKGVGLTSGTRYALINIVHTNGAGSKGGPLWVD